MSKGGPPTPSEIEQSETFTSLYLSGWALLVVLHFVLLPTILLLAVIAPAFAGDALRRCSSESYILKFYVRRTWEREIAPEVCRVSIRWSIGFVLLLVIGDHVGIPPKEVLIFTVAPTVWSKVWK